MLILNDATYTSRAKLKTKYIVVIRIKRIEWLSK